MNSFWLGYWDADLDLDPEFLLPFGSYGNENDEYYDGYTVRWFPVAGDLITCGNRADLPKAQRRHDWVCLGKDIMNKGKKGICEVLVFACAVCGRDWRD